MNQVELECTDVFEGEHTEQEMKVIFTRKWVEFINEKERQAD